LRRIAAAFFVAFAFAGVVTACHDLDAFGPTVPHDASVDATADVTPTDASVLDVHESSLLDAGKECGAQMVLVHGNCQAETPSCLMLDRTCGVDASDYCCAADEVEGGTFYLGYDEGNTSPQPQGFQTTLSQVFISPYVLDDFEVTVGRFRKFMNDYNDWRSGDRPSPDQGANPNHPPQAFDGGDGGEIGAWEVRWNSFPNLVGPTAQDIIEAIDTMCNDQGTGLMAQGTWTDDAGANESLPMTCTNWFEAYMFCIWDGGRLPTEAEWEFAAADGPAQRAYPWSEPSSDVTVTVSRAVIEPATNVLPVGSLPAGIGAFGQYDLAGNAYEWVMDAPTLAPDLDKYSGQPSNPLDLSGELSQPDPGSVERIARGGSFDFVKVWARTSCRNAVPDRLRYRDVGIRCARATSSP
jgi:formylglycine-generating enzyme